MTIVTFSRITKNVLEAAEKLEAEGISCEVINLRTIRPLDVGTIINSVNKTHRFVFIFIFYIFNSQCCCMCVFVKWFCLRTICPALPVACSVHLRYLQLSRYVCVCVRMCAHVRVIFALFLTHSPPFFFSFFFLFLF